MTTYYLGCCHDCREYVYLSNAGSDYAEKSMAHWIRTRGHGEHRTEWSSEYDEQLELRIQGKEPMKYLGFGSWKTVPTGKPYKWVNEQDRYGYDWDGEYAPNDEEAPDA